MEGGGEQADVRSGSTSKEKATSMTKNVPDPRTPQTMLITYPEPSVQVQLHILFIGFIQPGNTYLLPSNMRFYFTG
jgi:hypothetical protein